MKSDIQSIMAAGGLLSRHLGSYETRHEQIAMAEAVARAIKEKRHLVVEAGTGVGKSLAYLIPFILRTKEKQERVLVSTYTKTLQEQLVRKDLPFLEKVLGIDFRYMLFMGSENYLCLRRLYRTVDTGLFDTKEKILNLDKVLEWSRTTKNGMRSELAFEVPWAIWSEICRETDLCLGKKCPHLEGCFYTRARKKAHQAQILVINHHLFFANIASGYRVLPRYDSIVFDEAHLIEDVATNYLGREVSNFRLKFLCDKIYNPRTQKGLLPYAKVSERLSGEVHTAIERVNAGQNRFFGEILLKLEARPGTHRIRAKDFVPNSLVEPLREFYGVIGRLTDEIRDEEILAELDAERRRCIEIGNDLEIFLTQALGDHVYWVDIRERPRRGQRVAAKMVPIKVASILKEAIFEETFPVILTSATLSVAGSFEFFKRRVGVENGDELRVDSSFDYQHQALLYSVRDMPDPGLENQKFTERVPEIARDLLRACGGRAFVLFTSYHLLNSTYDALCGTLSDMTLLKQGDMPRFDLLERFKQAQNPVLFGTSSFWQGIDVPGKALECVVITKLPFAVPDDPVTEARLEEIRKARKNPFMTYQVPQAVILFKQGFGRLIRTKADAGMVAVLDPRVHTKGYGRFFIDALPSCLRTEELDTVRTFFDKIRSSRSEKQDGSPA
jgi:ATP-dependent DNA helicase DinG